MANAAVRSSIAGLLESTPDCPAGHRFSLYLPIWDREWKVRPDDKTPAVRKALPLGAALKVLESLRARQAAFVLRRDPSAYLVLDAISTAPFATGLGIEHPTENGFAFLVPYGVPYLAGSGVKGVLRRAAEQLEEAGELAAGFTEALFGPETVDSPEGARRGAITCWDVFPLPPGGKLTTEVMTPHFSDYYQGKQTPHDAGKPNPITILALPAGSKCRFVLSFEPALARGLILPADWQDVMRRVVSHAFDWLGFGAKTAVGYGAMQIDEKESERQSALLQQLAAEKAREAMSPQMRQLADFRQRAEKVVAENRGNLRPVSDAFMAEAAKFAREVDASADWTPEEKRAAADVLEEWVPRIIRADPKDLRKRLGLGRLRGST